MQVILLERVGKIGNLGDVVNVKAGFARNYLLPQRKAMRANDANMKAFEARRAELEAQNASKKTEAEALGASVNGTSHIIIRAASDAGALYGSVTPRDIVETVAENGHTIDRQSITLDQPIKALGLYNVNVVLHPEVIVAITVNVARSQDEAELQAQGKTIQSVAADAEAEAEADLAALLDDVGAAGADEDDDDLDDADNKGNDA